MAFPAAEQVAGRQHLLIWTGSESFPLRAARGKRPPFLLGSDKEPREQPQLGPVISGHSWVENSSSEVSPHTRV